VRHAGCNVNGLDFRLRCLGPRHHHVCEKL
jgi:hypothetical protein